jgi:hypothetical protein
MLKAGGARIFRIPEGEEVTLGEVQSQLCKRSFKVKELPRFSNIIRISPIENNEIT